MVLNLSGVRRKCEESFCGGGAFVRQTKTRPCCGECLYPAVCFHPSHTPVCLFSVTPPTPQPIDDVDIYFETPADDKEHSRFQRAKEQLEIRHRSRMERVRGSLFYENEPFAIHSEFKR